jgi:phosphatidylglycerophosphate synthase
MLKTFAGDKKVGSSLLSKPERKFIDWMIPKIPKWITSRGLTMLTLLWCAGIVITGYLASVESFGFLWIISIFIFLQWLTDSLDGSLGRYREAGWIRWGYYMDHFLDYVFLCSILVAYSLILPDQFKYLLFFLLVVLGAFMVNSFLAFAATNTFKIHYLGIGPTEVRIIFIIVNTLLALFGKTYMGAALPYILALSLVGLAIVVYRTQKEIEAEDIANKNE